jgi:hypothetical protein
MKNQRDLRVENVAYRFLEAARSMDDNTLFYTVYKFFEQRNELTPSCQEFVQVYNNLFLSPISTN